MRDDSAPSNGETRTPSGTDPLLSCLLASYRQRGYAPLGMAADEATGRLRNEAGTLLIRCVSAEGASPVAAGEVVRFQRQVAAEPGAATGLLASRHGFDDEAWRLAADHPTLRLLDRPALESMLGPVPELFSASVPPPLPLQEEAPEAVPPAALRRWFLQRLAGGRQRPRLALAAAIPLLLVLTVWGYPAYLASQIRQAQAQAEAAARQPRFAERPATAAQAETDSAKKERLTGVWIPRPIQPSPASPAVRPHPAETQPAPQFVELTRSNVWTEQELAEWQRRQEESIRALEQGNPSVNAGKF